MKLFSSCIGNCCICAVGDGFCLAGIGDNDFIPSSKEEVIDRLKNSDNYRDDYYRGKMIEFLKSEYNYDYNENK